MDRQVATIAICGRVEEVLKELSGPVDISHGDFFKMDNLWKREILVTCSQIVEYYRSVLVLTEQSLLRPAAALSRTIHECCFRFEYLSVNESELRDWTEWQMKREYQFLNDFLKYELSLLPINRWLWERDARKLGSVLEISPGKAGDQWKSNSEILRAISSSFPQGHDKRLPRLLFEYPSNYVHIRATEEPTLQYVQGASEASVLLTIKIAMELCRDKGFAPNELIHQVNDIAHDCDLLLLK